MSKSEGLPEHSQPSGGATPKSAATEALLPSAVLSAAADLIEPEGKWTRGTWARTIHGLTAGYDRDDAACWCARGAIGRCARSYPLDEEAEKFLLRQLRAQKALPNIAHWNDAEGRTQAEVVAALRAASELAKSEGQ